MLSNTGERIEDAVGAAQQQYLQRAAEAADKRVPWGSRGGWPTAHGQPWDKREIMQTAVAQTGMKPWDANRRSLAEMRAMRGEEAGAEDPLQPLWW